MRRWVCVVAVGFAACAWMAGCSNGSAHQTVHGAITLDDQPVKDGHLRFDPVGAKGVPAEGFIKDGQYTVQLPAGSYKVQIFSPRAQGKMTDRPRGPGANAVASVETIPAKYNVQTTLTAEVKPGVAEINFPLTMR